MLALSLTADLEGYGHVHLPLQRHILTCPRVTGLRPVDTQDIPFYYMFKVECTSCRETHPNWVSISRFVGSSSVCLQDHDKICIAFTMSLLHPLNQGLLQDSPASHHMKDLGLGSSDQYARNPTSSPAAEERPILYGSAKTAR